jgi:hypothetical protein
MAVLLESGIIEWHVAVAMPTAVRALDIVMRYEIEAEGLLPPTNVTVCWHTLHTLCIIVCLDGKGVDKTFGGHVTPRLYKNCFVLFIIILCSRYKICV